MSIGDDPVGVDGEPPVLMGRVMASGEVIVVDASLSARSLDDNSLDRVRPIFFEGV
jgi:hypothetical protein